MKDFSYFILVINIFVILIIFDRFNPIKKVKEFFYKILKTIGVYSNKVHEKIRINAQIKNKKTVGKSFLYKLIKSILFNLSFYEVTVEGYLVGTSTLSIIGAVIVGYFLKSFAMCIVGYLGIEAFIIALSFAISSSGHYKREIAIMDAEDLIIASLNKGFTGAVETSIDLFDDTVKPYFQQYLDNVKLYKLSLVFSVNKLSEDLGEEFNKFSEKIIEYIKIGSDDTIETFQDDLTRNAQRRVQMFEIQEQINEATLVYLISLIISIFMAINLLGSMPEAKETLLYTALGHLFLIIIAICVITGFILLQVFRRVKN